MKWERIGQRSEECERSSEELQAMALHYRSLDQKPGPSTLTRICSLYRASNINPGKKKESEDMLDH